MKLKRFILLGLLISTGILNAQTDFRPGYVIKSPGDTIFGQIDYRGDLIMSSLCKFKAADNTITDYAPGDIEAYRFLDSKYFVTKEINNKKVFMEYLINGKVNIYYIRDEKGDHYYIDKEGERLSEIPYEEGIEYVDHKKVFYESTRHIGFLKYYMKDAPELQSKIESVKEPDHRSLIKLAEDYQKAVCKGEECIIYEKQLPFFKINLEGLVGVAYFSKNDDIKSKSYFQKGAFIHFWMPRVNENLYIKTGFLHSNVEYMDGVKSGNLMVLFQFAYLAPKTYRIRPSYSIGVLSPSYSAGIEVRLDDYVNFGIQGWANFTSGIFPFIPVKLYNCAILGSVYIEL